MPLNSKKSINIGIIGMGKMGKGLLYQCSITPGIQCVAVADINIQRCEEALTTLELPYLIADDTVKMEEAIDKHFVAACDNGSLLTGSHRIDVIIEASSSIISAATNAITALNSNKHLVLMNSEIDLTFGPVFRSIAGKNNVICTSCDGDQHGVLKHLIDDIRMWGFELVMAGNIKGFLDRYANPTTIIPEADKRELDYRMCTAFTDGTKLNIEMAIIANGCNLSTKIPGMLGPIATNVHEVFHCFDFNHLWQDRQPFVDYIVGAEPGGGVFVIGYCDNPYQQKMLAYYKMGSGPYYLFYRPYHLCHVEAMGTILKYIANGQSLLIPDYGMQTNVYAYAKRKLEQGERLDGVGGYTCYGKIENTKDNIINPGLPICISENVIINRAIEKDQKIFISDITCDFDRIDFNLYRLSLELSTT